MDSSTACWGLYQKPDLMSLTNGTQLVWRLSCCWTQDVVRLPSAHLTGISLCVAQTRELWHLPYRLPWGRRWLMDWELMGTTHKHQVISCVCVQSCSWFCSSSWASEGLFMPVCGTYLSMTCGIVSLLCLYTRGGWEAYFMYTCIHVYILGVE